LIRYRRAGRFSAVAIASAACGMLVYPAAGFGVVVPALIFALTKVAIALFPDRC
jgi:hypothetical protein